MKKVILATLMVVVSANASFARCSGYCGGANTPKYEDVCVGSTQTWNGVWPGFSSFCRQLDKQAEAAKAKEDAALAQAREDSFNDLLRQAAPTFDKIRNGGLGINPSSNSNSTGFKF